MMDARGAAPQVPGWHALPALALEALAEARAASIDATPVVPDAVATARLVQGVEILTTVLGRRSAPAATVDAHHALATAVELTAELADAARHVAWTAGFSGQEQAAEVADAITTTAWALRVLAELGLRVVPAPDAGEPAPPRDPAP